MPFRLWDRIKDWVVLTVLIVSSVAVMLFQNDVMVRGLRGAALETTSWLEARFAWVGYFSRALDENERLRRENIEYSSELARMREARLENERLRALLAFRDTTTFDLIAARIISKDIFRRDAPDFITLDVGRSDSVDVDMAVVDERGIIGKVTFVSENYSRVMPYKHADFRVPARILPLQADGIVSWPGTRADVLQLEHISKTEPVEKGHLVITSGFSSVFPAGYPIGRVDSVALRPGRNELEILLTPATNLQSVGHVFVVRSRPDPEQLDLEERSLR